MYKVKIKKGSLPKYLKQLFKSYNEARSALRKHYRKSVMLSSGVHPTMADITSMGYTITRT